jgi:uncharacterized PurR-regulated membrane protein YhhQ (DUF165 family)
LLSFLSRVVSNFVDVILFFVAACRHARYSWSVQLQHFAVRRT